MFILFPPNVIIFNHYLIDFNSSGCVVNSIFLTLRRQSLITMNKIYVNSDISKREHFDK